MKKVLSGLQKIVNYNYSVVIEKDIKSGYYAYVPSLPGCYSQGKTFDKTLENIKEAVELYLEVEKPKQNAVSMQSFISTINVSAYA